MTNDNEALPDEVRNLKEYTLARQAYNHAKEVLVSNFPELDNVPLAIEVYDMTLLLWCREWRDGWWEVTTTMDGADVTHYVSRFASTKSLTVALCHKDEDSIGDNPDFLIVLDTRLEDKPQMKGELDINSIDSAIAKALNAVPPWSLVNYTGLPWWITHPKTKMYLHVDNLGMTIKKLAYVTDRFMIYQVESDLPCFILLSRDRQRLSEQGHKENE